MFRITFFILQRKSTIYFLNIQIYFVFLVHFDVLIHILATPNGIAQYIGYAN